MSEEDRKDAVSGLFDNESVKEELQNYIEMSETIFDKFCTVLHNTGSIIAGGSVLSAINKEKINDIDIYTHKEEAKQIVEFLDKNYRRSLLYNTYNISPAYDESFLRANNIKMRFHLIYASYNDENAKINIDIMIVDDSVSLVNVVSNFDLSFCKVYFDGRTVNAFYPEHIREKSGVLEDEYVKCLLNLNKFTIDRVDKYRKKKYKITYSCKNYCNTQDVTLKKSKTIISSEEWIVKKVYGFLINILKRNALPVQRNSFIIDEFLLLDFTYDCLFKLVEKVVKERCYVPGWILCSFKTDKDIFKHLLLYSLMTLSNPFSINSPYKETIQDFIKKIDFPQLIEEQLYTDYNINMLKKRTRFFRNQPLQQYYNLLSKACVLRKIALKQKSEFMVLLKRSDKTRNIPELNLFTAPSPLTGKSYPEKKLIDDQITGRCKDLYAMGLKNINAYLRGEKIQVFTADGEIPEDDDLDSYEIEPVPPEEARKRLVFFVETSDGVYIPVCYNLDMIEKSDIKTNIFSTTCARDQQMQDGLNDPLFKLNMGDFSVFVYLKKLLWALYKTKKQVFILTKPDPPLIFDRTASLTAIISGNWVSVDHCQAGSDKSVYNIEVCEEKEGNLCYPTIDSNDIEEFDIDTNILSEDDQKTKMENIRIIYELKQEILETETIASSILSFQLNGNDSCDNIEEEQYREDEEDKEDEEDEEDEEIDIAVRRLDEEEEKGHEDELAVRLDFNEEDEEYGEDEEEEDVRHFGIDINNPVFRFDIDDSDNYHLFTFWIDYDSGNLVQDNFDFTIDFRTDQLLRTNHWAIESLINRNIGITIIPTQNVFDKYIEENEGRSLDDFKEYIENLFKEIDLSISWDLRQISDEESGDESDDESGDESDDESGDESDDESGDESGDESEYESGDESEYDSGDEKEVKEEKDNSFFTQEFGIHDIYNPVFRFDIDESQNYHLITSRYDFKIEWMRNNHEIIELLINRHIGITIIPTQHALDRYREINGRDITIEDFARNINENFNQMGIKVESIDLSEIVE
jgi:hypothetical protein